MNSSTGQNYLNLSITTYAARADALGELLEQFDAAAISYRPRTPDPVFDDETEDKVFWDQTTVTALLSPGLELDILLACVRNRLGTENILDYRIEPLQDEPWVARFQDQHGPRIYADRLCVYPGWSTPPETIPCRLQLDPGLAFGTGTHPTTALCLEWLARAELQDKQVIDYGCGSGILGLAALQLGAGQVAGVDNDEQALLATRVNAGINDLSGRIECGLPGTINLTPADVLLANILLNPLLELAPRLAALVTPGGHIVLSGILSTQAEECLASYTRWFNMEPPRFQDEWAMLTGMKQNTD